MTKIFIDHFPAEPVYLTGTTEYGDVRSYWQIGDALIVCRNGLNLLHLQKKRVDAKIGWDTVMPGFHTDETMIGQQRTKITIHREITGYCPDKLSDLLSNVA
jgi:hypothetical protein